MNNTNKIKSIVVVKRVFGLIEKLKSVKSPLLLCKDNDSTKVEIDNDMDLT